MEINKPKEILYIKYNDKKINRTEKLFSFNNRDKKSNGLPIYVDFDKNDNIVGVELL